MVLDTGQEVVVTGRGLLGRKPSPTDDRAFAHVIALEDPERSISKTHLEFGIEDGQLWVTDLRSTNGTRVFTAEGEVTNLVPGERCTVAAQQTVQFGDRYFTVKVSA
jgi:predicted component of type VI protein secretion system